MVDETALSGKYAAYPEYKDSGIEWLDVIPTDWTVSKVKYLCSFQVGWTPPTGIDANFIGDNLWANISDLKGKYIEHTAKQISDAAADAASMSISPKGSLLYSFKLSVGAVSFAAKDMYTNEAIASFLETSKLPLSYLYYVLPKFVIENASTNIYGARILNQELINNAFLLKPSFKEAEKIASFLDHETAKIDTLIDKQQQLIQLLKEKRQAVISHAVTKGLNPNAPMRDSGVEWLGEVPEHWGVGSLRWFIEIASGEGLSNTEIETVKDEEFEFRVVGGNGTMGFTKKINTTEVAFAVGRVGALCGNVHLIDQPCWITDNALKISSWENYSNEYLYYILIAARLNDYASRSAQPLITGEQVKALKCPIPPINEQIKIGRYIHAELKKIEELISRNEQAVNLAKERRTALISAAVTGKIDVRNWSPA